MVTNDITQLGWGCIENLCTKLEQQIKAVGQDYDGIIAVTRGGMIPAGLLASYLNIKFIETIGIESYFNKEQREASILKYPHIKDIRPEKRFLVVDDISDTGETQRMLTQLIGQHWPRVVLVAKPSGMADVHFVGKIVEQETWIVFPWEKSEEIRLKMLGDNNGK